MSRFEKFAAERDVVERIEQLRTDGFREDEITVISKQSLEHAYLKHRDVNFKNAKGTTWDKFVSMFSDDDPVDKVLRDFEITDSEREHFREALYREEILLLKDTYGVRGEGYVQNETREFHETQHQDAQGLESEVEQNTRLDAQNVTPEQQSGYSYEHGTGPEGDRLHTAEDDHNLKDTARSNEYGYDSKTDVQDKKPVDFDKNEYSYDKRPGKDYGYK